MTEKTESIKETSMLKLKPVLHGFILNKQDHLLSKGKVFKNILYYY
jgi:hypothetical protein